MSTPTPAPRRRRRRLRRTWPQRLVIIGTYVLVVLCLGAAWGVWYANHRLEDLERVVIVAVALGIAPWGWLQWPIYLLAGMAWITVVQRMLFVRRQLRELAETS